MSSQKKIEANRSNGCRGRGPTSLSGKSRSRFNALKHGLNIPISADRHLRKDVLKIARAIAGEGASNALMAQALIIAETECTILRIGQMKLAAFEHASRRSDAYDTKSALADSRAAMKNSTASAFARALPVLKRIDRYERRAYSRRKKAIARLNDLRLLSQVKL